MTSVLFRAMSLAFIVLIGIILRRLGLTNAGTGDELKKILMNVTLPAAIFCSYASLERPDSSLILVILIGLLVDVVLSLGAVFLTRGSSVQDRVDLMICIAGFNVGTFCMPFVQSFFSGLGIVSVLLFDVGNAFFVMGLALIFAQCFITGEMTDPNPKKIVIMLFKNFALDVYVGGFILAMFGIRPPEVLANFLTPVANANSFVAMLMLGTIFHLELTKGYLNRFLKLLVVRYAAGGALAAIFFFFLPFAYEVRLGLAAACLSPISNLAPVNTRNAGVDAGLVSCVTSGSIIVSMVVMTLLLMAAV